MKKKFRLKIIGESPRSIFLAFVLAKLNCEVYIYDFFTNSNSKKDYQIFLISNSLKNLLSKFDIWNEIEGISYDFTSLSINDNLVYEQLLLRAENISKKYLITTGWTANYSDIKKILINKLIDSDNVHFISNNQLVDESLFFDYEFNFKNYDKVLKIDKFPFSFFKRIDEKILIFNVNLRGHVEKRLYEINTNKGFLVLTPLSKNLYQVIWHKAPLSIKETSLTSKSFFIDNLTTLLPNELKIDQIIGDINILDVNTNNSSYCIKHKSMYFNENKFKSNTLYDLNFNIIIKYIFQIYNFLEKNESRNINILTKVGIYYFLIKYLSLILNFSFSNFLFNLFLVNNIFSLLLRKLLLTLLRRINLIKILFMRDLNIHI